MVESDGDFARALSVQKTAISHTLHQKAVRDDLAAIDSHLIIRQDRPPLVDAGSCVSFAGCRKELRSTSVGFSISNGRRKSTDTHRRRTFSGGQGAHNGSSAARGPTSRS
jgi:hypothetical protein